MKKFIAILLTTALFCQYGTAIFAEGSMNEETNEQFGLGLESMTDEQWSEFKSTLPLITDIKPNSIALSRTEENEQVSIQTFAADTSDTQAAALGSEMTYTYPGQSAAGATAPSDFPLTSAVDVSSSLTFPKIGNQGSLNSCVAWSMVYYQLTNNNCVVRGLNAKTASGNAVNENVMSPGFVYTLINGGLNNPTYYDEACAAITSYGSPSVNDFSADMTASSIQSWCTSTDVWNKAIYNKPAKITYGYIDTSSTVNSETPGVLNLKRILSNGYVVTIPTYVNSFNYTRNTTGGVWGCRYASNTELGGHAMTVVGYDDNFWVDVNGNGKKDYGETGAFKIANSWGTNAYYYTNGYVWVPYDALGSTSAVSGAPSGRDPVFRDYYFIEPKKDYTPLLIANVTLKTNKRNQIAVKIGISDADAEEAKSSISVVKNHNIAFNTMAKSFLVTYGNKAILDKNFSGGNYEETVTVPFDLTPVIKSAYGTTGFAANSTKKLYVEVTDDVNNGSTVTLGNVTIIEPITGKEAACTNTGDLIADNSSVTKTVDFQITPFVGYSKTQDINVTFNSNLDADSVSGNLFLKAPDNQIITPEYSVNNKKITIYSPPTAGYTDDVKYELHMGTPIKSLGGNHLSAEKIIYVYILDDLQVYRQ